MDSSSSSFNDEMVTQRLQRQTRAMMNMMIPTIIMGSSSKQRERQYIYRDLEGSHHQLWEDYFAENCTFPLEYFHQRFRMRRELFLHILTDVVSYNDYFVQKPDFIGRLGLSSIQKIAATIRILAYGCSTNHIDEYLKLGESTAIESLQYFCDAIITLYTTCYLRSPNEEDIVRLLREGEDRGFPGMYGSLDCMHWEWKNCPTAWHGSHRGHYHNATLILEPVASKDLWIWHAFFGMTGSFNDLNVLDHSPLFDNFINGRMPPIMYWVNGSQYTLGYYLTDGTYPQ